MRKAENSADIEKWLCLLNAHGVGPVVFGRLLKAFGSVDRILGSSVRQLMSVEGVGSVKAEQIARERNKFDAVSELEQAAKAGVWLVHLADARYPGVLKQIYDPPPVLYVKGTLGVESNLGVAIVGCRRCSHYGMEQAGRFGHLLAAAGFTIVSGGARGIDSAAHQGALAAKGRTIAVMGCGLSNVYPPENKKLFEMISEDGACISELPMSYEPLAENFPARNRIIAGLSLGTIVVEASLRSGALITARVALDYNREVLAIPGRVDSPVSKGPHKLLREGARLVESIDDVVEALGYIGQQLKDHTEEKTSQASEKLETCLFDATELNLSESEKLIYEKLGIDAIHLDDLIESLGIATGAINAGVISLRLKGLIKQLPGNHFVKKPRKRA
jgi:DNA processing protein